MAGESDITQNTLLICKGQELTMLPTIKAGYIIWGANPIPAISQPQEGQLYGWLPLSNAYRHFQSQNVALNWLPHGIYFINNLVIYPNMNEGDNNPIIPPNAPLKGAMSRTFAMPILKLLHYTLREILLTQWLADGVALQRDIPLQSDVGRGSTNLHDERAGGDVPLPLSLMTVEAELFCLERHFHFPGLTRLERHAGKALQLDGAYLLTVGCW